MTLNIVITAIILFVIVGIIILKLRNKRNSEAQQAITPATLDTAPKTETAVTVDELPEQKSEEVDTVSTEPEALAEPVEKTTAVAQVVEPAPLSEPAISSVTEIKTVTATVNIASHIPEDAQLRRHYLTHLQAMIESLHVPCPSDASLHRHYEALVANELAQCVADEKAVQKLLNDYEDSKKTTLSAFVVPVQQVNQIPTSPVVSAECPVSSQSLCKLPEDSVLKRHYLTHLYAQVAATLPPCPTDSILRRHYQTQLDIAVQKLLED